MERYQPCIESYVTGRCCDGTRLSVCFRIRYTWWTHMTFQLVVLTSLEAGQWPRYGPSCVLAHELSSIVTQIRLAGEDTERQQPVLLRRCPKQHQTPPDRVGITTGHIGTRGLASLWPLLGCHFCQYCSDVVSALSRYTGLPRPTVSPLWGVMWVVHTVLVRLSFVAGIA